MLELLARATLPVLSLKRAIAEWGRIAYWLAEAPRKRCRQTGLLFEILS
jgi:hypothetical protein